MLTCALFSYINFRGASETGKAGNVVSVGKIVVIALCVALGFWTVGHLRIRRDGRRVRAGRRHRLRQGDPA